MGEDSNLKYHGYAYFPSKSKNYDGKGSSKNVERDFPDLYSAERWAQSVLQSNELAIVHITPKDV